MSVSQQIKMAAGSRRRLYAEALEFLERRNGRRLTAEEEAQWDRYNARIDGLAAEIETLEARHRDETEAGQLREAQSFAYGRAPDYAAEQQALRAWANGAGPSQLHVDIRGAMRERELLRQGASPSELRVMNWDTGSSASVVPTSLSRSMYSVMEAEISALRMPTTRVVTDSGETMDFGAVTTNSIATQVAGQGTTIAGTDPVLGKLTLTPDKFGELIRVSNEVLSDAGVDMANLLAQQVGRAVSRRVNQQIAEQLIGGAVTGANGTVATGGSLITPGYEALVNLQYSVNSANRNSGNAAWVGLDSTAGTLRKLRDGNGGTLGSPIWQPSVQTGIAGQRQPDELLGHPFFTDPNIAAQGSDAKVLFYGDWNAFYARFVGGGPVIERNDSVFFASDETAFRGKWRSAAGYADLTGVNLMKMSVS